MTCYAPFRPRRYSRYLSGNQARLFWLNLPFLLILAVTGVILPLGFLVAFVVAIRRAAWSGNFDAIVMEWDWLRVRGPVVTEAGQHLAALARGR